MSTKSALQFVKEAGIPVAETIPWDFMRFEGRGRGPVIVHNQQLVQNSSATFPFSAPVNPDEREHQLSALSAVRQKSTWLMPQVAIAAAV